MKNERIIAQRSQGLKFADESICSEHRKPRSVSMNDAEQVQPSSRYYLLAIFFVAVGVGLMIYFLVSDIHRIRESMIRMEVPGQMDLELKQHVNYAIFVEYATGPSQGAVSTQASQGGVTCGVHLVPSGETIASKQTTSSSYTYGTRRGVSIMEFDVPHDGTYTVGCQGPSEYLDQKVQVAIGGGASKAIPAVMAKSILCLMGGIVVGVLIFVRVAMLRLESRRDIRERGLQPV
jgi:hypothetical protein